MSYRKIYQNRSSIFSGLSKRILCPPNILLGECHMNGKGVTKDEAKGLKLYREAAAAKDVHGMANLGAWLARFDATRPDTSRKEEYAEAFKYLTEAQEMGNLDARLANLGAMAMSGTVPGTRGPDPKRGAELLRKAQKKETLAAPYNYARCLDKGIGVNRNQIEAANNFLIAAKAGIKGAQEWCRANPTAVPRLRAASAAISVLVVGASRLVVGRVPHAPDAPTLTQVARGLPRASAPLHLGSAW